jgi:protein-tyrosine phosphatase
MVIKGFRPIITHPERNPSIIENPELLRDLLDTNALAQITAGSLVGDFGAESRYCAEYLVERGVVSFIATDSHSTVSRPPVLTEGLKVAERIVGTVNARRMVFANPSSMVSGSLVVNVA